MKKDGFFCRVRVKENFSVPASLRKKRTGVRVFGEKYFRRGQWLEGFFRELRCGLMFRFGRLYLNPCHFDQFRLLDSDPDMDVEQFLALKEAFSSPHDGQDVEDRHDLL